MAMQLCLKHQDRLGSIACHDMFAWKRCTMGLQTVLTSLLACLQAFTDSHP